MRWYILAAVCAFVGYKSYKGGKYLGQQVNVAYAEESSKAMEAMLAGAAKMKADVSQSS